MPKSQPNSEWEILAALGSKGPAITDDEVRQIIKKLPSLFKQHLISSGVDPKKAQALVTKFRDAGRRSAPWMAFSSKVPGRPQDGKDGNRINRWLLQITLQQSKPLGAKLLARKRKKAEAG
jgi:hypothetical protein